MNKPMKFSNYKQEIADLYNQRSNTYDNSEWHLQIAHRLVEYAQIKPSQKVLDLGTGTGMAAIKAASLIGDRGSVIGIDISSQMLQQARNKAQALNLNNIEFILADAEYLEFPANSFDRILCSSAFIWMWDLQAALSHWHRLLKSEGIIAIHAFSEESFVAGVVSQQVVAKHGVQLSLNKPTGTVAKCHDLCKKAGFKDIEIKVEPGGYYISLEIAKKVGVFNYLTPGQYPNPISKLSSRQLAQAKAEFKAELSALQTDQGIWNDTTTFYVLGRK